MHKTLLIKGGTIVNADCSVEGDVLIKDGKIAKVGVNLEAPEGARVIDAKAKLVIPGGIDPHTHFDMPFMGTVSLDDYYSGSRACIAGGTTCFIDFIVPAPKQSLLEARKIWAEKGKKSCCDYSNHMCVTWWSDEVAKQQEEVAKLGITSFKHFQAYKGALMLGDDEMIESFSNLKKLGCLPQLHCENGDLVAAMQNKLFEGGVTGPEAHNMSRPPHFEGEAANRACLIAESTCAPLYIVHTTCNPAVEAINHAQKRGVRVWTESTIGHLTKDDSNATNKDWNIACREILSPPFRHARHQKILWNALQARVTSLVSTDHCTFNIEQKQMGRNDFRKIPNGCGCVEERMSLVWNHGVQKGLLTENDFVRVTSTAAAQIFNMYPKKGVIREGADADIVVWNPDAKRVISVDSHHSKCDYNIYEGWEIVGVPEVTVCLGEVAWEVPVKDGMAQWKEGKLKEEMNGRFIERPPFCPTIYPSRKPCCGEKCFEKIKVDRS